MKFYKQYLIERNTEELLDDVRNTTSLEELLILYYEIEYKLFRMMNSPMLPHYERLINIFYLYYNSGVAVVDKLTQRLIPIFDAWLDGHAITDPHKFAEVRVNDLMEYMDNCYDPNMYGDVENLFVGMFPHNSFERKKNKISDQILFSINEIIDISDFVRYKGIDVRGTNYDIIYEIVEERCNDINIDFLTDDLNEYIEDADNLNNVPVDILKKYCDDLDEDEMTEFWDDIVNSVYVINGFEDLIYIYEDELSGVMADICKYDYNDFKNILIHAIENSFFYEWYSYWSGMGIDSTRENIEEARDILEKLPTVSKIPLKKFYDSAYDGELIDYSALRSFVKQTGIGKDFAELNIVINTSHQTGDMTDYFELYGGIDAMLNTYSSYKSLLSAMTDGSDVPEWDSDLREMGFKV